MTATSLQVHHAHVTVERLLLVAILAGVILLLLGINLDAT